MPVSELDAGDAADIGPAAREPLVIAHRGASSAVAEHTVGAYRLAIAEGADALECDVRLSADGELVCLHDRTLERTGGSNGIVSAMTLAELRAVDWGAWKHAGDSDRDPDGAALVTLRELVELALDAGREIGLAVETKHPSRAGGRVEHAVAELLDEYGLAGGRRPREVWVRMMSFSAMAVRRMASLCPELPLVHLVSAQQPLPLRRTRLAAGAGTAGLDLALLHERPGIVAERHDAGNEVWVWTVDDEEGMGLCLRLDVDAIITNRPAAALDLMASNR
jgi:glycerophosphoryl diester phosphodiesterase